MLLLLINIVIIVVVGAICFYLIDRFVRWAAGKPDQDPCSLDLPRGNRAEAISGTRHRLLVGAANGAAFSLFLGLQDFIAYGSPARPTSRSITNSS
jgi:hypothetical protein